MGGGEEGAKREAVLDEIEGTRAEKARRKAEELALMASKNQARSATIRSQSSPPSVSAELRVVDNHSYPFEASVLRVWW